jgi:hypothetical protein
LRRASEAVAYTRRQCLHVAAVLTGSVIALIQADRWAMPVSPEFSEREQLEKIYALPAREPDHGPG